MTAAPFQTLGDAAYGDKLRESRAAEAQVALKRLANEVRSCRALGCAGAWDISRAATGEFILTLALPTQVHAARLAETLHGAD